MEENPEERLVPGFEFFFGVVLSLININMQIYAEVRIPCQTETGIMPSALHSTEVFSNLSLLLNTRVTRK